jgi:hypothetical protein
VGVVYFAIFSTELMAFLKGEDDDACTLAAAGDIDDVFNISVTDLFKRLAIYV